MNNQLSPTMQDAVAYAKKRGGKILRRPGGYWGEHPWFGTTTIQALISRGVAEYSQWQERKSGGRFPIEVTIKQ
jgi:hypothetical protein